MISISYTILFSVTLQHEYFASGQTGDVQFVVSPDCQQLFNQLKVQWRVIGNRLVALIRVNDAGKPYMLPAGKTFQDLYGWKTFRIYLQCKDGRLFNYTNLPSDLTQRIFYFSNLAANPIGSTLYLSNRLPDIPTTSKAYVPGDFAMKGGSDNVYESLTSYTSSGTGDLSNLALWAPRGVLQYPGPQDQQELVTGPYLFTLPAAVSSATVKVFGFNFNAATPAFDVVVTDPVVLAFEQPTTDVPVSLATLRPGRYLIQVNGSQKMVYYDPQWPQNGTFGVIELFNHLPQTNIYSLLAPADTVQNKPFLLQFPTRRVLWKYIRKDGTAQAISDTGGTGYSFALQSDAFVSSVPIPLSDTGQVQLKLDFNNGNHSLTPLANPTPARLVKFTQGGYDYLCSEMYLNY